MIGIGAVMDIFAPEHLGGLVAAAAVLRSAHGAVDLHVAVLDGVQPGHLGGNDLDRQHPCRHPAGRMRPGAREFEEWLRGYRTVSRQFLQCLGAKPANPEDRWYGASLSVRVDLGGGGINNKKNNN